MVTVMCAPDIGLGIMLDNMAAHYIQVDLFKMSIIITSLMVLVWVRNNLCRFLFGCKGAAIFLGQFDLHFRQMFLARVTKHICFCIACFSWCTQETHVGSRIILNGYASVGLLKIVHAQTHDISNGP